MLVHGIRTQGEWQQLIQEVLEKEPGVKVVPARYGFFDLLRFLLPFRWARQKPVERIYELIRDAQRLYPDARLSILAHSFGTYIVGRILEREFDIKIHRLALCGSVQPDDYPWHRMDLGRIGQIVNDCGWRDIWPVLARSVTWGYGASGTFGFGSTRVVDRFHDFRHSEFFTREFAEAFWRPFFGRGKIVPGRTDRRTTPWWLSVLTVVKLRWVLVLGVAAALVWMVLLLLSERRIWPDPVPEPELSELRLDPDPLELQFDRSFPISLSSRPSGAPLPSERHWLSEDPRVATVSPDGVVKGVGKGWTRVRASVRGRDFEALHGESTVLVDLPRGLAGDAFPTGGFTLLALGDLTAPVGETNVEELPRVRTLREYVASFDREVLVLQNGELGGTGAGASGPSAVVELLAHLDGRPQEPDPLLYVAPPARSVRGLAERGRPPRAAGEPFHWLVESPGDPGTDVRLETLDISGVPVGLFDLRLADGSPTERFRKARGAIRELRRRGSRLVVGLTRTTPDADLSLARQLGPGDRADLLLSGAGALPTATFVEETGTWVIRAEREARTVVVAYVRARDEGALEVVAELQPMTSEEFPPDPEMLSLARRLSARLETEACQEIMGLPAGCFERALTRTEVPVDTSFTTIRYFEAGIGNWITDRMRDAFADRGAQAALINAGALRLDRRLPAGAELTTGTVLELLPFENRLVLLRLDGATLGRVLRRARESRGEGAWLQVSGLAFHASEGGLGLTVLGADGTWRPVKPDDELLVATIDFLAGGGDGYEMLAEAAEVAEGPLLRTVIVESLEAAPESGIAPRVEGRICDSRLPGPCLAQSGDERPAPGRPDA